MRVKPFDTHTWVLHASDDYETIPCLDLYQFAKGFPLLKPVANVCTILIASLNFPLNEIRSPEVAMRFG